MCCLCGGAALRDRQRPPDRGADSGRQAGQHADLGREGSRPHILAGQHYRLWLIDHTRAFQPTAELLSPERVERLRRKAWTRLLETSGEELADATRDYLDAGQVGALKERRQLLVEHIQGLIEKAGEDAILY